MTSPMNCKRVAIVIAAVAFAGCGDRKNDNLDTSVAAGAVADTASASAGIADARDLPTTDAGAIDLIATIDAAEVEEGQLARTKAQDASVKSFARLMIDEHSRDMKQLGVVVKNASIVGTTKVGSESAGKTADTGVAATTPSQPGIFATLQSMHQETMRKLQAATSSAFDREYIDAQVTAHQEAQNIVQELQTRVQAPQLSQHLSQVANAVQRHLDRAREIQTKLGAATSDTAPTSNYRPK